MSEMDETTVIPEVEPDAGRNRLHLILAVVGAVVVAAAVWFLLVVPLLLGGDAEGAADPATAEAGNVAVAEEPTTEQPPEEPIEEVGELPLVTYEVFLARDPFEPVVPELTSATSDASTTVDDGDEPIATDGPDAVADGDQDEGGRDLDGFDASDGEGDADAGERRPETASGCEPDEDQALCDGRMVRLLEVTESDGARVAVIQVGETIYEVTESETFARNFLVQAIANDHVLLVYGDEVVGLREGDRVLK